MKPSIFLADLVALFFNKFDNEITAPMDQSTMGAVTVNQTENHNTATVKEYQEDVVCLVLLFPFEVFACQFER